MEQSEKLNAEIGLEEKNTILQAWTDFKDSIFNVLFVILDKKSQEEEEQSLLGLAFESGLDYLQIMAFPFNTLVIDAWNGGSSLNSLAVFFQNFSLGSYLPNAPYSAFLFMLYGLILIIMLIIADIVYVSYSFSKKKFRFTFPLVILAQIVPLFVTVLFLPIAETLLSVIQCQQTNGGLFMSSYPTVQCWVGWHLFHSTVTLLFTFIFVLISSVVALALFEPRMTSGRLTARQNSNGQIVFILNKIVLQFLFSFSPFQSPDFYVFTMFLLSFWNFWCYAIKQPYYSKSASKFYKICSTYYFWTTLMLIVGQILGPYGFDGALVVWVSGLPFFAIIIYYESASDINTLFSSNLKFKTGEQLSAHLAYVLQLIGNQADDKNSYMLLIGYIEKHKEICNQSDCPLKAERKRRRGEENMEHSCQQVLKQVERMFKNGIKKFPDCTKLRINFAFFQLEQLRNKQRAYEEFGNSSKLDPNFQQQFNIYRFKKIIRENLENREESDADLVETIRFENHISLLQQGMLHSAKLHKQFWTELKEEIPDLKKLNTVGAQITEAGNIISQNYSELSKISASACEVLYSYAHYLILVSEDYGEGKEMLANARKIFQDRQTGHRNVQEVNFEEQSLNKMTSPLLVLATSSPSSIPRIVNTNLMFTEITGYQREELIGHNVSDIAPHLFKQAGLSCLELLTEGDREREGFLSHKFDHVIAVQYTVSQFTEEEHLHVVFKLASMINMKQIVLANESGEITDYNLLAHTAFKDIQEQAKSEGHRLSLTDIGLGSFQSQQFRRQSGSPANVFIGQKQDMECMVQVEPVSVQIYGDTEQEDEEEKMVVLSEKIIGWRISIAKIERGHMGTSQLQISSSINKKSAPLDDGVLQLYDSPNVIDIFISTLAETRQFKQNGPSFKLTQKIKTMRLLNNEIKMVYSQGAENDYSDSQGAGQGEDDRELFKFDDENYQAKLRAAINTNLNHVEVINLRRASIIFLLLLFGLNILELYFENTQVSAVNNYLGQISLRAEEYSFLTKSIMAAIDPTSNYTALYSNNSVRTVQFSTEVNVQLTLENDFKVSKNLKDAVILLQSRLLSYFQQPGAPIEINSIFMNYIAAIYPAFLSYPLDLAVSQQTTYILAGAVGVVAFMMMSYWIYVSLCIDKKRYDIMIWFLDIPIPYVTHLGNHCDKYLKEFITVKELGQKGIPLDEEQDSYEEYATKKNSGDDDEIQEQIKARKSLISKNKKETLISKINLSSLSVVWLLFYSLSFSILMIVMASNFYVDYNFLIPQWILTSQSITIDNTLYLTQQLSDKGFSVGTNLTTLKNQLQLDHKGVITENGLESFNYNILNFHLTEVASIYNTVYFSNLCKVLSLNPTNLTQCQTLVGSKLNSGYEVYSKYLITPEQSLNPQIRLANELYVVPALLMMLNIWEGSLTSEGNSFINLCSIMLYVFIILSTLIFLLLWLYYLRKLNTELNQTIQMLNMIPFKLLPKSRKETKLFIAWIICQANKTKHDSE